MIPKFRAWHNEFSRMMSIKNVWFQDNCLEELELNDEIMNDYITAYPDEIELMQSTGLFDKKGVEIFEGDILADLSESGDELVYLYVIYKDGKFMAVENEEHGYTADLIDCTTYHSVVGNIYENAKLLGR